jgi:hypothetical protein
MNKLRKRGARKPRANMVNGHGVSRYRRQRKPANGQAAGLRYNQLTFAF